jgi:hypothetical protein
VNKKSDKMKKFTKILTLVLLALMAISAFTLSLFVIWESIDPKVAQKIEDTIWLTAILMIVSFIINCALEE